MYLDFEDPPALVLGKLVTDEQNEGTELHWVGVIYYLADTALYSVMRYLELETLYVWISILKALLFAHPKPDLNLNPLCCNDIAEYLTPCALSMQPAIIAVPDEEGGREHLVLSPDLVERT